MTVVYCVEDDDSIREMIVYALKSGGFDAKGFNHGNIDYKDADLVLLDIMLPNMDGFDIIKIIRNNPDTKDIPIIMLTAKTDEIDKVKALDMGADDYIEKPFKVMELLSRIKAILRRVKKNNSLSFKELSMDIDAHKFFILDKEVILTHKEFELLRYLMENKGNVLTRDMILNSVWGYDYMGETRTIDAHIRSLRSKINPFDRYIKTVINVGYRLDD